MRERQTTFAVNEDLKGVFFVFYFHVESYSLLERILAFAFFFAPDAAQQRITNDHSRALLTATEKNLLRSLFVESDIEMERNIAVLL